MKSPVYNYPQDFLASLSNEACIHDIHPHVRSPEGPKDCCGRQPRSAQVLHMQGDNALYGARSAQCSFNIACGSKMAGIEELCSGARKTPARAELFANCITQTCVQMQGAV